MTLSKNFIWIGLLILVVGILLFVFMYTLNRKSKEEVTPDFISTVIVTNVTITVPQTITFYSTVNYDGDLSIYVYKVGDLDNKTVIVNNFTAEPNVIYTEPIDLSALSSGTYNTGYTSSQDGSGDYSIYTFII